MRVNFGFKVFFNSRLAVRSRTVTVTKAIGMLTIFFIASSFTAHPDPDLRTKEVNLMIRQIGHRLLLQAGDSTSRVLPVTEITEGTFLLQFENAFVFNHDSLMVLTQGLLPKTQFPSGYTVTVHDCISADIVYGFQVNTTAPDLLACQRRHQPSGCYSIEFAFSDLYKKVEQTTTVRDQRTEDHKSLKVDPQKVETKPEESRTTTLDYDTDQLNNKRRSVKADPQEANLKPEKFKTTTFNHPIVNLVWSGVLVLVSVALLVGHFRKGLIAVPVPVQPQTHTVKQASGPESASLGKFLFDVKDQRLLLGTTVVSLTDKECRILELLNKSFGELIPRETLMQEVWINEGVITGRSLDMFVSKLRKKLSADPALRITNVHGKGYKLEMDGMQ